MKIKLICGFRRDQEYSVEANEAHKAYFLFLNPEMRGVFSNGLAIKGSQIQEIVPDYQGTMGWNPTHTLDTDDWNELREQGIDRRMQKALSLGKDIAMKGDPSDLQIPLSELVRGKYATLDRPKNASNEVKQLAQKMSEPTYDR